MRDEDERRPAADGGYRDDLDDTAESDDDDDEAFGVGRKKGAKATSTHHRRIIIDSDSESSSSDDEDDGEGDGDDDDSVRSNLASALDNLLVLSPVEPSLPTTTRTNNNRDAFMVEDSSDGESTCSIEPPHTNRGKNDAPIVLLDTTNDDSSSDGSSSGEEEVVAVGSAGDPSTAGTRTSSMSGGTSGSSTCDDLTPRRLSWQSARPSPVDKKKETTAKPKVVPQDAGNKGREPVEGAWTFDEETDEYYLSGSVEFCDDYWPDLRIPQTLYDRLYAHQKAGVQWMATWHEKKIGGIVGDDMGMGKTFQTLTYLGGLMRAQTICNALIVCPVSVLRTWEREGRDVIQKSCVPRVNITVVSSDVGKQRRISLLAGALQCSAKRPHLIITTYGLVTSSPLDFCSPTEKEGGKGWDYVVCDEGHKLKNPATQVSKSCKRICRSDETRRVLLSGTPIQNNMKELWALFDWACSGRLLGNIRGFKNRFGDPIEDGRYDNVSDWTKKTHTKALEALQERIRPHILQRLKSDVFKDDLPTKCELVVFTHLSQMQRSMYEDYVKYGGKVRAVLAGETSSPLEAISWLKKLCGHPSLVLRDNGVQFNARDTSRKELIRNSAKLRVLVDLLKQLRKTGHRTLVFSQSTKILDIIEAVLAPRMVLSRIDGSTKERERQRNVDNFNSKRSDVDAMLLSTKAAGIGLTLTGADRAVIYDPSWNPADDSQAVDRCFRIGQTKDVTVYRFISAGTVEEAMYKKIIHKDGIKRTVMSSDGCATERHFEKDELRKLFELAPAGECEMLSKFSNKTTKNDTSLTDGNSFLDTLNGVVGVSSHDLLYTRGVIKVDEPDTPFAGTPLKKMGRAHRALAGGTKIDFGSALTNELAPLGKKHRNILAPMNGSRPSDKIKVSPDEVRSNQMQMANKITHGQKENDAQAVGSTELTELRDFSKIAEEVESMVICDRTEEAMGLLLDVLDAGQLEGTDKLKIHKKITALAIQLRWL